MHINWAGLPSISIEISFEVSIVLLAEEITARAVEYGQAELGNSQATARRNDKRRSEHFGNLSDGLER